MKNKNKNSKGFTLIEAFVAITVLMIVVLGPMSLLSSALRDSRYIGDELTATYLAQEGVELMIDQRNNNYQSLETKEYSCALMFDPDRGYQCDQGDGTIFTRTIEATNIDEALPKQYEVTSTVTIERGSLPPKDIISSTILFLK